MKSMKVGARLSMLIGLFSLLLVGIGSLGLYSLSHSVDDLKEVYEARLVPLSELGSITNSLKTGGIEMLSAFQHNPEGSLASLHTHPIGLHVERITKGMAKMELEWNAYRSIHMTEEEKHNADLFDQKYQEYKKTVILPTLEAFNKGDFSLAVIGSFLKHRFELGSELDALIETMAKAQQEAGLAAYEAGVKSYETMRLICFIAIFIGVVGGIFRAWRIIRSISQPLTMMRNGIVYVQENGDFTQQMTITRNDEIGQTILAFNGLQTTMRQLIGDLHHSINQVRQSALAFAENASQSSGAAIDTSTSATDMAASIEEMTTSIHHVGDSTKEALDLAHKAGLLSKDGGEVIRKAVEEINKIAVSVRHVSGSIGELDALSERISSVIQVIKEVADQTNLLALNAAIEAARAGESGRGFAVVADEVRKLAERTSGATVEIATMVGEIQNSAHAAVESMAEAVTQVDVGVKLANEAGNAIIEIRNGTDHVAQVVSDISASITEQVVTSNDIASRIERVAQSAEQNSASSQHAAESARQLEGLAQEMHKAAERFRV